MEWEVFFRFSPPLDILVDCYFFTLLLSIAAASISTDMQAGGPMQCYSLPCLNQGVPISVIKHF